MLGALRSKPNNPLDNGISAVVRSPALVHARPSGWEQGVWAGKLLFRENEFAFSLIAHGKGGLSSDMCGRTYRVSTGWGVSFTDMHAELRNFARRARNSTESSAAATLHGVESRDICLVTPADPRASMCIKWRTGSEPRCSHSFVSTKRLLINTPQRNE